MMRKAAVNDSRTSYVFIFRAPEGTCSSMALQGVLISASPTKSVALMQCRVMNASALQGKGASIEADLERPWGAVLGRSQRVMSMDASMNPKPLNPKTLNPEP